MSIVGVIMFSIRHILCPLHGVGITARLPWQIAMHMENSNLTSTNLTHNYLNTYAINIDVVISIK